MSRTEFANSELQAARAEAAVPSFAQHKACTGARIVRAGFPLGQYGMATGSSIRIKRATDAPLSAAERSAWHRRASRLYEELRRPAAALIRRAYGSTFTDDEVDDIYSSAWLGTLRALERRHGGLDDDEIRNYVLAAVANHGSKELRRRKRKPVAPIELAGAVADRCEDPQDAAASREAAQVTRDLLSTLPPRRRAVMLLRYGWGLDPTEVCGLVDGLSPRAYRKEVTKGVDELTEKVKLVEEGGWCADREPLLKAYASGLADREQVLQAEHHLAHCRHCHEFVGKLTGHLHDLGSGILVPGALEAIDPSASLLDRISGTGERLRDAVTGAVSRPESSEVTSGAVSARGAGAASAGVVAKLAGLGTAGKIAVACLGGGAAATACVAAGIAPIGIGGDGSDAAEAAISRPVSDTRPNDPPKAPPVSDVDKAPGPTTGSGPKEVSSEDPEPASEPPVAPEAPPVQQDFGVESAAAPAPSAPAASSGDGGGGSGGAAVQQEFGP